MRAVFCSEVRLPGGVHLRGVADVVAPYVSRLVAPAANYADELGGLLGQKFVPSIAASDERDRKKKKNQR